MTANNPFYGRLIKSAVLFLLSACILIIPRNGLSAYEVKKIETEGNSIELDIFPKLKGMQGNLRKNEIEAIGVKITNEYHSMGYTTSYVEKIESYPDGTLRFFIRESRIVRINITGVGEKEKAGIMKSLNILTGTVYNRFIVEEKVKTLRDKYDSIKIYPVNYEDTGDVFLSIKAGEKSKGEFYGGIGFEPIYGITPEIGYYYPFDYTALDIYGRASYREGRFRRAEGDLKFFLFPGEGATGIYAGAGAGRYLEEWQSQRAGYIRMSAYPALGVRSIFRYAVLDLYFNEIISDIKDYNYKGEKIRDYDTRITLDIGLSNSSDLLSKKEAIEVKLSASSGKSDMSGKFYLISSAEIETPVSPAEWLRIIPGLYSYYTTSKERYFWQYVYDKRMPGFFDDYTASGWKNIAGLEMEFEIVPQFIYAGPFADTAYFLDESRSRQSRTGGGVKCNMEFGSSYIGVSYAWDLSGSPSKGGVSIMAGGKF